MEIAAGILRKNQSVAKKISRLDSKIKNIDSQMQHIYNQLLCVKKTVPKIKSGNNFKVNTAKMYQPDNLSLASVIADALLNDSNAIPLVARFSNNDSEDYSGRDNYSRAHKKTLSRI